MNPTRPFTRRALSGAAALALWLGGAVGALAIAAGPASADTITVTNTADDGSSTSLREVLESVNDGDVVVLTAGATYQLTICFPDKITPNFGEIQLSGAVTIQGNGATIEQTCNERVLNTQFAITLENVTITGGDANGPGGGLLSDTTENVVLQGVSFTGNTASGGGGGGVAASGNVTVTGSTFSDNHDTGSGDGGGIKIFAASGTTTITGSTFTGNTTTGWGGAFEQQGINPEAAATGNYVLQVTGSTFTGNSAEGDGGGALDTEDAADIGIENSTFAGDNGGWGGAVGSFGPTTNLQVFGTTFNGNTSLRDGGAVHIEGNSEVASSAAGDTTVIFADSTITGNTQAVDGAVNVDGTVDLGYVTMTDNTSTGEVPIEDSSRGPRTQVTGENNAANITTNTLAAFGSVVAQPNGGPNCEIVGSTGDAGYNFSDDTSCGFTAATSRVTTPNDPVLGALASNGGPTQTLLPLTGSPLLDAIPTSVCTQVGILVDQRGVTRPQGTGCDIGAVEVEVPGPAPSPAVVVTPKFTG